jgi:hypothetical protein
VVTFLSENNKNAGKVLLAGNFSNWELNAIPMTKVDSGWVTSVKLRPGKYLYKFIADGNWTVDKDQYNRGKRRNWAMGQCPYFILATPGCSGLDTFEAAKKIISCRQVFNNWRTIGEN